LHPLLGNDTAILTAVNGIPYWYFYAHGGCGRTASWRASIPAACNGGCWGRIARSAVSFIRDEVVAPGVIQHVYGNKLPIGEPDGTVSPRIRKIAEIMTAAGFETPIRERIRDESGLSCGAISPSTRSAR